jgi:hypothetical protein
VEREVAGGKGMQNLKVRKHLEDFEVQKRTKLKFNLKK